ncbi:carbohydrate ABC transporter ATP-binding protein, CUT1 family [Fulvimarina manganoxydans]|uniref:Carbohydrate ABC transporter ATP-binding protein, CUT1 family n=1 Tax=Fulvimarina manganoxydans TaxID=937218 RepID=A0A1W2E5P7_9HYPH|nr:ABC transporter ATP-binding protein [Fulvimarina manganoxydans]SMD05064.1 carbohydrate ABC transporter ATP-binding protein, CUT1 family [Fulvimarina manganoxydans]
MGAQARWQTIADAEGSGLTLSKVRKSFGTVDVLHGIDLAVEPGEFVVFLGPSGCGKSTLLRVIAGLEDASDGTIRIGGRDVTDTDPSERQIAMVFQSYALYPHMSVKENMSFGLRMNGAPKAEIERRVASAVEILQLQPLLDRRPGQLSGGQRQRVAIGRAIVRDPQIFLFDEPLSNLDAELRVAMRIEIAKLHQRLGNTMIYVTHDQTEAMTLADKIVILRGGRLEQVGRPAEIYDDPANAFVAGFIGSPKMNLLPAELDGDGVLMVGGHSLGRCVPDAFGAGPFDVGIRPEHLVVVPASLDRARLDQERSGMIGPLPLRVDFAEYLGSTSYIYGEIRQTGGRESAGLPLTIEARRGVRARPGETLMVTFDPNDLRYFDRETGERLRLPAR